MKFLRACNKNEKSTTFYPMHTVSMYWQKFSCCSRTVRYHQQGSYTRTSMNTILSHAVNLLSSVFKAHGSQYTKKHVWNEYPNWTWVSTQIMFPSPSTVQVNRSQVSAFLSNHRFLIVEDVDFLVEISTTVLEHLFNDSVTDGRGKYIRRRTTVCTRSIANTLPLLLRYQLYYVHASRLPRRVATGKFK